MKWEHFIVWIQHVFIASTMFKLRESNEEINVKYNFILFGPSLNVFMYMALSTDVGLVSENIQINPNFWSGLIFGSGIYNLDSEFWSGTNCYSIRLVDTRYQSCKRPTVKYVESSEAQLLKIRFQDAPIKASIIRDLFID